MSYRSNILSNIETVLKGVSGIDDASVYVGKLEDIDLDNLPVGTTLPLVFCIQGPEQKSAQQSHGFETWDWTVSVEGLCVDTAVETLYEAIHAAMMVDITRGGYALRGFRVGGDVFPIDPGRALSGFQHVYQIQYRHPFGVP